MLIDWFTVIAQIVNFLILLALLKVFLFDRVTSAMDKRAQNIQEKFDAAEESKQNAQEAEASYREKAEALEEAREEKLKEAEKAAKNRREELLAKAREEVETQKEKWRESLAGEKTSFLREVKETTVTQIFRITEKALAELAGADLEERVLETFLARISEKKEGADISEMKPPFTITTGFPLSEDHQNTLRNKLFPDTASPPTVRFETNPELLTGIEVTGEGAKITWHGADYLKRLEDRAASVIESEAGDAAS